MSLNRVLINPVLSLPRFTKRGRYIVTLTNPSKQVVEIDQDTSFYEDPPSQPAVSANPDSSLDTTSDDPLPREIEQQKIIVNKSTSTK